MSELPCPSCQQPLGTERKDQQFIVWCGYGFSTCKSIVANDGASSPDSYEAALEKLKEAVDEEQEDEDADN